MADPTHVRVVAVESRAQLEQAYAIRLMVFVDEQHVPREIELDEDDAQAFHALATLDGRAVGCGRFVVHGDEVKIGRMAVLRELRGTGIGRAILEFLMDTARARGFKHAVLHAQHYAENFYAKQGFQPVGEIFEEAGIPHRRMTSAL